MDELHPARFEEGNVARIVDVCERVEAACRGVNVEQEVRGDMGVWGKRWTDCPQACVSSSARPGTRARITYDRLLNEALPSLCLHVRGGLGARFFVGFRERDSEGSCWCRERSATQRRTRQGP